MWTYAQRTGELWRDGRLVGRGYAGWDDGDAVVEPGEGKNDPGAQATRRVGPLPVGRYTIGPAYLDPHTGPGSMRLEPDPGNEMFGRSGFLMHGDSRAHPGAASLGCIVLSPALLHLVAESHDTELHVVAELPLKSEASP